ncbi:MAG: DEAD/DEAH box helicase [Planctomycetota bacterium]
MPEDVQDVTEPSEGAAQPDNTTESNAQGEPQGEPGEGGAKKKRRRRRRRRKTGEGGEQANGQAGEAAAETTSEADASERSTEGRASDEDAGERSDAPRKKRSRRRGGDDAGRDRDARGGRGDRNDRGGRGGRGRGPRDEQAEIEPDRQRTVKTDNFAAESFAIDKTFADLGLKPEVIEGIDKAGFKHPTHIQAQLVPIAITGKDILGQAKTGTGKTLAFGLPLLHQCEVGAPYQALILCPTRELAVQIRQDIDEVASGSGLSTCAIYGGQSINTQAERLAQKPEIIVGTPGRVMDMAGRGYFSFSQIRFAVLDEVDRMFDFGFRDDIKKILDQCPRERQTVFVSATMSEDVEKLARRHMRDPEKLVVSSGSLTVDMVKQSYVTVEGWDKKRMLAHVLKNEEPALTLIFCRMKRTVDSVVRFLDRERIDAHAIHGDMSQGQRNRVMDRLRRGDLSVLVASDLASRGIDVDNITHVINFDLPDEPDLYVHRIGRTARAGNEGVAWSLVTPAQGKMLTEIEHLINAEIPAKEYPEFEPSPRPDNYREEEPGGRRRIEIQGVEEEKKGRFESGVPDASEMDAEELAKKFPGGIVPKKMPKRMIRGRVRTRGR